jgi:uncharacterized membrane protein HdeD (DUF308 family)
MLTRNWWAFALRGIAAIALGVLAFVAPAQTLTVLIAVFAVYAIFDGALAIMAGLGTAARHRWWLIIGGVAGIAVGLLTIASPGTTALALVLLIGAWAIVTGVAEVVAAYTLRDFITREWLLALSGVVSVAFGIYLLAAPGSGILAVLFLIGYYAIFSGIVYLAMGLRLRSLAGKVAAA